MSQIRRISIHHLEVGMYISGQSEGVSDQNLSEQGEISKAETLEKLKDKGIEEVYIDISKGKDSPFCLPLRAALKTLKVKNKLEDERPKAKKIYREAVGLVGNILQDVKLGKSINIARVETLATEINESVLRNENALLCLSQIRAKDKYLMEHSINVAILMGIFARHLGFEREMIHELVTGALLHDIGKIRVPNKVLNKPGKLTPEEWQEMQNHVVYGLEVLIDSPGVKETTLDICKLHHERMNGSGYPNKLGQFGINQFGRMAAIVDVYDAITADRVYHQGKSPGEAIKFMLTLADGHLDKALLYDFIRCMSIYPVGSIVELSNGKIGVVIETHREDPSKPTVKTFFNKRHKHYEEPKVVNLASKLNQIEIVGSLEARSLNINTADFI